MPGTPQNGKRRASSAGPKVRRTSRNGSAGVDRPVEPVLAPRQWQNRIVGHGEEAADQLLANPRNWRIHPKAQQDALKGVLAQIGWVQDVIVNQRTGFVVDGHARVALAISAGERVPVVYVDLDEQEEAAILATLDPLSAMAGKDDEIFAGLVAGMDEAYKALVMATEVKGFSETEGLTDPDDAPEPPAVATTVSGDLWLLGEHRVLCGDSTSIDAVQQLCDARKTDLVFTDPPYGVGYDGGTKPRETLKGDENTALYSPCCQMAAKYSKPEAALYLWHAGIKGIAAAAAAAAAGYEIRCELVWNKNLAQFGALSSQYKQKHEPCYYCFKRGRIANWYGPTNEVTVWDCDRAVVNEFHPTQKPVALAERAIGNSSKMGDVALDLFLGSGSTLIACEKTGRICYGMEIAPEYIDVIVNRWQNFTGKQATLDGDGRKFDEIKAERFGVRLGWQDQIKEEAIEAGMVT